jgi:carboxymethylenebutenolidase
MSDLEITTPDGPVEAYLSRPPQGEGPGVLFFMDAIGLRPQIRSMMDRIASWGYVVVAPNLFHREGPAGEMAPSGDLRTPEDREAFFQVAMPRVGRLTSDLVASDLDAYVDALQGLEGVRTGSIGVTGYCMGARVSVRAASLHPDAVAAAGGFHGGGLVTEADDSPHRGLPDARAAFVFGHADQDGSMPPEAIAALEHTMDAAGLEYSSAIYPGAPHGYSMADTPMYQEEAAERHFTELRALLDAHLLAAS